MPVCLCRGGPNCCVVNKDVKPTTDFNWFEPMLPNIFGEIVIKKKFKKRKNLKGKRNGKDIRS